MEAFLQSVPPLTKLTLGSYYWRSGLKFDLIADHGSHLQELKLHFNHGKGVDTGDL